MKINPIAHSPIQLSQNNSCITGFLAAIKRLAAKIFALFSCSSRPNPLPQVAQIAQQINNAPAQLPVAGAPGAITWAQKVAHEYPVNLSALRWITLESDAHIQDEPYQVGICSQMRDMENIPQLGHYNREYPKASIPLAIKLPKDRLQAFPRGIREQFQENQNVELYFIVYNDQPIRATIESPRRNLMYHTIAYPDFQPLNIPNENGENEIHWVVQQGNEMHETDYPLNMGIFNADGLGIDPAADAQHGMAFEQMSNQRVYLHGDPMLVSPNSARFYIRDRAHVNTFFSACHLPNGRAVAFLGMLVPDQNTMNLIDQRALQKRSLANMVQGFQELRNTGTISERDLRKIRSIF